MSQTNPIPAELKSKLIAKGYEIIDLLYNTDLTLGKTNEVRSLVNSMGDLYKVFNSNGVVFPRHESELPGVISVTLDNIAALSPIGGI